MMEKKFRIVFSHSIECIEFEKPQQEQSVYDIYN